MYRKLLSTGVLALVAGLGVAGCSPVKMGAAAIVGSDRITLATLDTEAGNLSTGVAKYKGVVTLSQQQVTQQTLSWLIRFQINERLAKQQGITVSAAQAESSLNQIIIGAKQQAQQSGVANPTQDLILAANGIPPNLAMELGRFQAIETQYLTKANGGTLPSATSSQAAKLDAQFTHDYCLAAKSLNIKVNPQFGQMNYATFPYSVAAAADTVSRPSGTAQTASLAGLTPAC